MAKNLPANAGGHRFDAWSRKIPHAVEQLGRSMHTTTEPVCQSPRTAATEPKGCNYCSLGVLDPVLCNRRSHCNEKPVHCN